MVTQACNANTWATMGKTNSYRQNKYSLIQAVPFLPLPLPYTQNNPTPNGDQGRRRGNFSPRPTSHHNMVNKGWVNTLQCLATTPDVTQHRHTWTTTIHLGETQTQLKSNANDPSLFTVGCKQWNVLCLETSTVNVSECQLNQEGFEVDLSYKLQQGG